MREGTYGIHFIRAGVQHEAGNESSGSRQALGNGGLKSRFRPGLLSLKARETGRTITAALEMALNHKTTPRYPIGVGVFTQPRGKENEHNLFEEGGINRPRGVITRDARIT